MVKLTDAAIAVLKKRYFLDKYETVENLFQAVCDYIYKDDVEFKSQAFESMCNLEFLPNTPTLINAGRKDGQLAACFVLPVDDSTDEIFETLKHTAIVHKTGGGTGFDFSNLRPKNSVVSGSFGVSSGPISFMKIFNKSTGEMKQGGIRRGANMGILRIDHPDIEEFITCKNEEGVLSNFNISVAITDDFMDCLKRGKQFKLKWFNKNIKVEKEIDPQYLWDLLIKGAWLNGEPGVIFIDVINKTNLLNQIETIKSTNPCQPKEAPVLTPKGISTIGKIKVGSIVWSEDGWVNVIKKEYSGVKKVCEYNTNAGVFLGTKNHRVVENGIKTEVQNAGGIDKLRGNYQKQYLYDHIKPKDIMTGIVLADGYVHRTYKDKDGYRYNHIILTIGEKDQDYFSSEIEDLILYNYSDINTFRINTVVTPKELPYTFNRRIPDWIKYANSNVVCGVLRGLYSGNGYVVETASRVGMTVSSYIMARDIQLLLSSIGISSYMTINKEVDVKHSNGVYTSKQSYIVNIIKDRKRFRTLVGFIQKYKVAALNKICKIPNSTKEKVCYDITSVEYHKTEKVYNITVDGGHHTYWSGGLNIGNCGEEPLPPYGSCVLGSINLSKFVNKNGKTDYDCLEKAISMGVRFLDNVISVNHYPLPQIKEESLKTRRIGLGIMGLADHLILKDIVYGSPECMKYLHKLMVFFSKHARGTSIELGKERGIPPALSNVGINRRNGTVTTIAPTGSLSLIAGCSSGCEPIFAKEYNKVCIDTSLNVKSSVVDDSREAFVVASEVLPQDHVKVLSVLQKYIDAGISKTINAPNDITQDEISKLFHLCYDNGCKSVSFYREGSRVYQALTDVKNTISDVSKVQEMVTKRPKCLGGYTTCVRTGRGKLYVTVNHGLDDKPFEVFLRIGKSGMEDLAYSEAIGRLISLAFRSNVSVKSVIKNLSGISGESPVWVEGRLVKSVPDAVAYAISSVCGEDYDTKSTPGSLPIVCPDCGENVVFEEGCVSCKKCGWSRCA